MSEVMLALAVGVFACCGTWLCLRASVFDLALGLTLVSYAVNLILMAAGGLGASRPPILAPGGGATAATMADPLPQALVLTAIVISFAMSALVLALAIRARGPDGEDGSDDPADERDAEPMSAPDAGRSEAGAMDRGTAR